VSHTVILCPLEDTVTVLQRWIDICYICCCLSCWSCFFLLSWKFQVDVKALSYGYWQETGMVLSAFFFSIFCLLMCPWSKSLIFIYSCDHLRFWTKLDWWVVCNLQRLLRLKVRETDIWIFSALPCNDGAERASLVQLITDAATSYAFWVIHLTVDGHAKVQLRADHW
jgi:hypothetical protein